MGACNDPKIRIEFLRSLENRTGFKALGNGDQQCAGLFNPGSFQCSLIERIARQHTNVVVFRSAGHVGLVFDYNEGLSSLLQFSSDQTAHAAITDENDMALGSHGLWCFLLWFGGLWMGYDERENEGIEEDRDRSEEQTSELPSLSRT